MVGDDDADDFPLHAPLIYKDCRTAAAAAAGEDYPGGWRREDGEGERQPRASPGEERFVRKTSK